MSITSGNTFSDYRIDPITQAEVAESITAEIQTVTELSPAMVGFYGFELNECPESLGIVTVTRNSDSQVFNLSVGAPGANEYYIDYPNQSPVVIFNSSEDGEAFTIAYTGIGAPMSVKRTVAIAAYNRSVSSKIQAISEKDVTPGAVTYLENGVMQLRNLTLTTSQSIYSNLTNTFGILEIFGNLTVNSGITLTLGRVLLIVHGDILGSGTISGYVGANGGDSNSPAYPGGGSGGGAVNIFCFGEIANTITIAPGKGGTAGAIALASTDGANAFIDYGGNGGLSPSNGGGGGGGIGNGGNGQTGGNNDATNGNAGSGGGGNASNFGGAAIIATGGSKNIWIGGGGNGGGFGDTPLLSVQAQGGQTGDLNLWSRYTSAPCTVNVTAITGGSAGVANYYDLSDIMTAMQSLHKDFLYYDKSNNYGINANGYWTKDKITLTNRGREDFVFVGAATLSQTITLPEAYDTDSEYTIQISAYDPSTVLNQTPVITAITATTFDVDVTSSGAGTITIHWLTTGIRN